METNNHTPKAVVLGMGNMLLKDEGIGVHVAHALQTGPNDPHHDPVARRFPFAPAQRLRRQDGRKGRCHPHGRSPLEKTPTVQHTFP